MASFCKGAVIALDFESGVNRRFPNKNQWEARLKSGGDETLFILREGITASQDTALRRGQTFWWCRIAEGPIEPKQRFGRFRIFFVSLLVEVETETEEFSIGLKRPPFDPKLPSPRGMNR